MISPDAPATERAATADALQRAVATWHERRFPASELQSLDPEGKHLVLLEPAVGPASLAVGARPVTLWDGESCIAVNGRL